jgi:predicted RND superfamily exporter protein
VTRGGHALSDIRKRIEKGFESFALAVIRNRLKSLAFMALVTAAMASQLPKITMDTSTEGFLHEDDPTLLEYNAFREQFGRDEVIILALNPPEVFDLEFLGRLWAFHEDLEEHVPHVDDIISLVNARNTRGEGDELIVEDLMEDWPEDEDALDAVERRVFSNPLYRNLLISEDGRFTTVVIKTEAYSSLAAREDIIAGFEDVEWPLEMEFLTDAENSEVVNAVRDVIERHSAPGFPVYLAGSPVVTDTLKKSMLRNTRRFMAMAVLAIAVFLFLMFRRVSGVMLPLVTVVLSLVSTVGIMALSGVPLKLPTQILPSFLLAVGVGDSVHILAIFYRRFNRTRDKNGAIAYTMGHSGLAIAMTSLTTAGGLLSFSTADVAPIADLGVFASAGVMIAFIYTIVLLPALLALLPLKAKDIGENERGAENFLDRMLAGIGDFATGRPKAIAAASALIILLSLAGASRLKLSHYVLEWLPEDQPVRLATEKIDRGLKGSISMEAVIETGRENGLYEPGTLRRLDDLGTFTRAYRNGKVFVGNTQSVADVLKEIHRALNEDRPGFYAVPEDRRLIAQEFLLFENSGSDDLEDFVDSQFSRARFTIKAPFLDAVAYAGFMDAMEEKLHDTFGDDMELTMTGMLPLLSRTVYNVMVSMIKSYVIAFIVITMLMVVLIGEPRIGLLSMLPNVMPVIMALGIMGWLGFPMDMFTILIGSIAIGLAVDDTIHFMHNFRRAYLETGDVRLSVHTTLLGTGRAMLTTTCVLSLGFFIYMFSEMNNLFRFGLLTGLTIIFALLADFLLAPALMALFKSRKEN